MPPSERRFRQTLTHTRRQVQQVWSAGERHTVSPLVPRSSLSLSHCRDAMPKNANGTGSAPRSTPADKRAHAHVYRNGTGTLFFVPGVYLSTDLNTQYSVRSVCSLIKTLPYHLLLCQMSDFFSCPPLSH